MFYHINPKTGYPGRCEAELRDCPFGGKELHFWTEEEAASFYEDSMLAKKFQRLKKAKEGLTFELAWDYGFMMARRSLREMKSDTERGILSVANLLPKSAWDKAEKQAPAFGKTLGKALAGAGPVAGALAKTIGAKLAWLPFGAMGAGIAGAGIVVVGSGVALTVLGKTAFQDQKEALLRPFPDPDAPQPAKKLQSAEELFQPRGSAEAKDVEPTPLKAEAERLARIFSANR